MDQLYVEEGYVDSAYFEIIVDSGVIAITPYFAEDYTDVDYVANNGSAFTIVINTDGNIVEAIGNFNVNSNASTTINRIIQGSADFSGAMTASMTAIAFKNHDAALDCAFTQNADVNVVAGAQGLLEYFADLDAQAARFRGIDAQLSVNTNLGNNSGNFGSSVDANATFEGASILTSAFSVTVDAQNVQLGAADLSSSFSANANAIKYIKKSDLPASSSQRPWAVEYQSVNSATEEAIAFNSFVKAFGTHSLLVHIDNVDPTTNSYVRYYFANYDSAVGPGNVTDDSWQMEFWAAGLFNIRLHSVGNENTPWRISSSSSALQIQHAATNSTYNTLSYSSTSGWNHNNLNHIVIRVDANGLSTNAIKVFVNGSQVASSTNSIYRGGVTSSLYRLTFGDDDYFTGPTNQQGYGYIDEFRILYGTKTQVTADAGYDTSASSITVPTNSFSSTPSTQILLHFDNTFTDDVYGAQFGGASLASAVTQTATLSGLAQGAADLTSAVTQTADAGRILEGVSDFDAVASQLAAAVKIGDFFVNADVAATFDIQEDLFKAYDAWLISRVTQTSTANYVADASATITGAFTPQIETDGFKRFSADLTATATLNAIGTRYQPGAADLSVSATVSAEGVTVTNTGANFASAFTQAAVDFDRFRSIRLGYLGDRTPKTISTFGNVEISTAQSKFGSGSALIANTGDYFTIPGDSNLYNGDFTVEMWAWASNLTQMPNGTIWDNRTSSSNGFYVYVSYGSIGIYEGINFKGLTSAGFNNSQWNHIAVVRNGTNIKVFVNGVQKISATVTTTNYSNRTTYIGSTYTGAVPFRAYIDEVRLSKSARYTGAFTPDTVPFISDSNASALLHLDTDFSDDVGYEPGLIAQAGTLSAVGKVADFFVNADVAASLTATGDVKAGVVVEDLTVAISVNVDVTRIRSGEIDANSAFTTQAAGVFVTDTTADLTSAFTQTADAARTRGVETEFAAIATQLSAAGKIAPYTAGLDSVATMSVTGNTITDTVADISSAAATSSTATRIKPLAAAISSVTTASAEPTEITGFDADLTMSATVSAAGVIKVFNFEQYYYTIPAENRKHIITRENRSHSVTRETRIYSIEGT